MEKNELKTGDKVKIKKDSVYYMGYLNNPRDIEGVIMEIKNYKTRLPICVNWDNRGHNSYSLNDLELVKEQPEFKILSYQSCKVSCVIFKLDEERDQYFSGNIFLRPENIPNQNIHSVMNKDGNTFDIGDEITLIEGVNKGNKFIITAFRMKKDGSTVCAITESHTPYGVGINKIEHYVEKEPEFVLPEKWCVKGDNKKVIDYSNKNGAVPKYSIGELYHHYPSFFKNGSCTSSHIIESDYTEITFEQFKKYVLKEEVIKESPLLIEARSKYSVGMFVKSVISDTVVEIKDLDLIQISTNNKTIAYNNGQIIIYNSVDWAREATLLEKAKRLYPVGTKFKRFFCVRGDGNDLIVTVDSQPDLDNNSISVKCKERGHRFIYNNGTWAEIIKD